MTATPQSVLDAGRRERERYFVRYSWGSYRVMSHPAPYTEAFFGDEEDEVTCQDFIEERVFRAMLRAMAEQDNVDLSLRYNLLALAGDDHG